MKSKEGFAERRIWCNPCQALLSQNSSAAAPVKDHNRIKWQRS